MFHPYGRSGTVGCSAPVGFCIPSGKIITESDKCCIARTAVSVVFYFQTLSGFDLLCGKFSACSSVAVIFNGIGDLPVPSDDPFRAGPPGIQRISAEAFIVIMNDRFIIYSPFFPAGIDLDNAFIDIFLDAPAEESAVFAGKRFVIGTAVFSIFSEDHRVPGTQLI